MQPISLIEKHFNKYLITFLLQFSSFAKRIFHMGTEYEKCMSGKPFIGSKDPQITEMILRTRRLLMQFNATDYADTKRKQELLREIFGSMGKGVHVDIDFLVNTGNTFL